MKKYFTVYQIIKQRIMKISGSIFNSIVTLSLLLFLSASAQKSFAQETEGQGIHFFKGTMKEAIAKAKAEKMPIFFDAYASWCGPCRYMDSCIFTRADIGDFFNNNFICVRMDMEKG